MPGTGLGSRPTAKTAGMLEWWAPGMLYEPEVRWFVESGASIDMTAADTFDISPASNEKILVNRVTLIVVDTFDAWADTDFGNQTAYSASAGITFSLRKNGSEVHEFTSSTEILNNRTLFANTAPDFLFQELDSGNAMASATWDFVGTMSPVLLDSTDDALRFVTGAVKSVAFMQARADIFVLK
jgi:hypothetical protein